MAICIKEKYQLKRRLGGGSFSETGQEVTLKLKHADIDPSLLKNEIKIYEELSGGSGIPQIYWHGYKCEFRVMAFQLLGPNLENLLNYCGRKFSLKTHIHSKEYIHRDVKLENMEPGEHNYSLISTTRYASINTHLGSPHDDMESLGYVLIYFLRGFLPWQGLKAKTQEHKEKLILERKQSAIDWRLYKDIPKEFKKYSEHVRSLQSDEKPNYVYLYRLFRNLFCYRSYEYDHIFD
ncbi:kinase-like protein [Zopfia rhizophila CBS 207.26]|uniref:Kinase-like protein n=1 Tax=Zopfia rhizophila CBS 207.26 TaxID=1314779 RepID=A0A6A6EMD5_9PEZI|nr:kinase-like protein [Zopfia rhizophila CBS 207.26]